MIDKSNSGEFDSVKPQTNKPFQWKRWLLVWVAFPATIAAMFVATGAHLGANGPDRWYTRLAIWFAGLF